MLPSTNYWFELQANLRERMSSPPRNASLFGEISVRQELIVRRETIQGFA